MSLRISTRMIRARSKALGYTLVELLVSIAVGLFLMGGLVSLMVTNSVNSAELIKSGIQIENGRYAMQLLIEDVQHAGFWGTYTPPSNTTWSVPTSSNLCDTAAIPTGFSTSPVSFPVGLYGYDGSASTPDCTPVLANRKANTDIVVVRRVSTKPVAVGSMVAGETYFQSRNCSQPPLPAPFVIDTIAANFTLKKKDCTAVESAHKYMVRIYYISTCNVCGTGGDTIPTLKVAERTAGAFVIRPLVEGIENLQVEYGIDTSAAASAGYGAADCFTSNPTLVPAAEQTACASSATYFSTATALKNWSNVVATRIYILARNLDASPKWVDNRTYDLGLGASIAAANDGFKRHVYAATARLYNLGGQREIP